MKITSLHLIVIFTSFTAIPFLGAKMIELDEEIKFNEPWYAKSKSDDENIKRILNFVSTTPTGKKIIEKASLKAAEKGKTLSECVVSGDGSLTDTTLVRRFQASDPTNVMYETRSKVYLNRHLKTLDAILDLAHELTHFTYREAFNPYDHRFNLKDFIKSTVEGKGGEVDAYLIECKVLKELLPGEISERSNCSRILEQKTATFSKEKGIREFYKVGAHHSDFMADLEKFKISKTELPEISGDGPVFISSAWGLPYPIAAVKEYQNIMGRVCKNDQGRLSLIEASVKRTPASLDLLEDYKIRCERFSFTEK